MAIITANNGFPLLMNDYGGIQILHGKWSEIEVNATGFVATLDTSTPDAQWTVTGQGGFRPSTSRLTGTVTSFTLSNDKGASLTVSEIDLQVVNTPALPLLLFVGGDDTITGSLLFDSLQGYTGNDTLLGLSGNDILGGWSGDDWLYGGSGSDAMDGGEGRDTAVFSQEASRYIINRADANAVVVGSDGTDALYNVERLEFSDAKLAFDTEGNAGQVYRLYQAAFAREPDAAGLGHWIGEFDEGKGDLAWVAKNFILSDEFRTTYGSPETVSAEAFLNLLYQNILGRGPDADGKAYWLAELGRGFARERVLASFSESTENKALVAADIQDGIWFV